MASKYDKMLPTKKQNGDIAQKAAENHRDLLKSKKNVYGNKTNKLSPAYHAKKRRKRPNASERADFFNTGKMLKSFRGDRRLTSKHKIVYALNSYLSLNELNVGLSKGKNFQYALPAGKKQIPDSTFKLIVAGYRKNIRGNLKQIVKLKRDFKITLTI